MVTMYTLIYVFGGLLLLHKISRELLVKQLEQIRCYEERKYTCDSLPDTRDVYECIN